jgi:hypothetical protein
MIIKKWSGTVWENQAPKTTTAAIFTDSALTTQAFPNGKLATSLLPNSVFDSLKFQSSFAPNATAANFATVLQTLYNDSVSSARAMVGYYLVASVGGTLSQQTTGVQAAIGPDKFFRWGFATSDNYVASPTNSGVLEPGDWIVIDAVTGIGTSGSPFIITFAVVNNTYETYTGATSGVAGVTGLVPAAPAGQQNSFLRGDATWVVPTNTTNTAGATDISTKIFLVGASAQSANPQTFSDDQVFATNGTLTASRIESTVANGIAPFITASATVVANLNANYLQGQTASAFAAASHTHTLSNISDVSATATEVNALAGFTGTVLDLNYAKDLRATGVTTTEFDILDGLTATTAELNFVGGVTSNIQTQLDGKAASSHAHGDITSGGLMSTAVVAPGNGDAILITDSSNTNKIQRGISIGTSTTTFLNNAGAWTTPAGTTYSAGSGIGLTGTTFSVGAGEGLTQESNGLRETFPLYVQTATPTTAVTNAIWYDIN